MFVGGASIHSSRCGGLFLAARAAADSAAWRVDCRDDSRRAAAEEGRGAGAGPKSSSEEDEVGEGGAGGMVVVVGAGCDSSLSESGVDGRSERDAGGRAGPISWRFCGGGGVEEGDEGRERLVGGCGEVGVDEGGEGELERLRLDVRWGGSVEPMVAMVA